MKKIISVLIALCMLLSVSALAEGIEITGTVQLDKDQLKNVLPVFDSGIDASMLDDPTVSSLLDMVNGFSARAVIGESGAYGEVLLRDVELFNAGADIQNGITVYTDLLPGYAANVSPETLQQLAAMIPDFSQFDITPYQMIVMNYIASIKTESKQVSSFKQGKMYTNRITVSLSAQDTSAAMLAIVDQLEKDAETLGILPILQMAGFSFDDVRGVFSYDAANGDDVVSFCVYANDAGDEMCIEPAEGILLSVENGSVTLTVDIGSVKVNALLTYGDDGFNLTIIPEVDGVKLAYIISGAPTADGLVFNVQMTVVQGDLTVNVLSETSVAMGGNGCVVTEKIYFNDMSAPVLTAIANIAPYAGEIDVPDFSAYKVLAVENIIAGGLDDATQAEIMDVLQNQTLSSMVVKLLTAAPEAAGQIMQLMTQVQQMSQPDYGYGY